MNIDSLASLGSQKIVVLGDVMVDHYRVLKPSRISPEAPVIIYKSYYRKSIPGGAANVAANLLAMGIKPESLYLCTVAGQKWPHGLVGCRLVTAGDESRKTTVKERIVSERQQLLRIDEQADEMIPQKDAFALLEALSPHLVDADALVISDYSHGVMHPALAVSSVDLARAHGVPIIVDSKDPLTVSKYAKASILLPNIKEAYKFGQFDGVSEEDVCEALLSRTQADAIGMTMGPRGILYVDRKDHVVPVMYPPLESDTEDEVVDVTGAGDTVTAAVAAGLSVGMPYNECIRLANIAAGIVVRKKYVATASMKEIVKVLEDGR